MGGGVSSGWFYCCIGLWSILIGVGVFVGVMVSTGSWGFGEFKDIEYTALKSLQDDETKQ